MSREAPSHDGFFETMRKNADLRLKQSQAIVSRYAAVVREGGSDHFPVIATFTVKR